MKICICSGGLYFEDSNGKEYAAEYEELANAYIKQDKYHWHDLRIRPDDLPSPYKPVLVYHTYYHYKAEKILPEYEIGWYGSGYWCGEAAQGRENTIIAWREIEPFEFEEEE